MKTFLTDTDCKNARPKADGKRNKLSDGGGLYLFVTSTAKGWYYRYKRPHSKIETVMALQPYPAMSLKDARAERERLEALLAKNIDPQVDREEQEIKARAPLSFHAVTEAWFETEQLKADPPLDMLTLHRNRSIVDHLQEQLGHRLINAISTKHVFEMAAALKAKVSGDLAKRAVRMASRIFEHCIAQGTLEYDVAAPVSHHLARANKRSEDKKQKRPAFTRSGTLPQKLAKVSELWGDIGDYSGRNVRLALQFLMLTMVRPGEVANAEWTEFDLTEKVWVIPAHKMKMRKEHHVPLSRQALAILKELQPVTGQGRWVFSPHSNFRTLFGGRKIEQGLSENTLNKALRIMGYDTKTEQCAHGFRSIASTLLNEEHPAWPKDAIELQLAHIERGSRADYNEATLWDTRVRMLQHWADRLDGMRAKVVPLRKAS